MLAEDSKTSRLEKAKMIVSVVVEENSGEKIGIVVFAEIDTCQRPLTFDLQPLKMFCRVC
jgi:Ca-activated chloride channel family protein